MTVVKIYRDESDFGVDLEKGKVECDEDSIKSPERKQLISFLIRHADNKPDKTGEESVGSSKKSSLNVHETGKPECDGRKEKCKKSASKPPRPPRGPSLDAADQKLIREITELAMLKRARIERLKTLKKTRASEDVSNLGNVLAMLFTVIFCFIIILEAYGSSKRHDHPLISVQSFGNPSLTPPGQVYIEPVIVHAGRQKYVADTEYKRRGVGVTR